MGEQPLRVVVDTHGRTPAGARVLDASAPTWVATAAELGHRTPTGRVDLAALLRALHAKGRGLVLLEGGPTLAGAFVRAGLVDRVVAYLAPVLLGAGVAALAGHRHRHPGRRRAARGDRRDAVRPGRAGHGPPGPRRRQREG